MGIIPSGILGPVYNKTGAVVGRKKGKINTVSGLPRKTSKVATAPQALSRNKLGILSEFFCRISPLINAGFKAYKKNGSARNAAHSYNAGHAFITGEDGALKLNYPKLVLSRGSVVAPLVRSVRKVNDQIIFEWLAQPQSQYCLSGDKASFLIVNEDQNGEVRLFMNQARRDSLSFAIDLDPKKASHTYHCYFCFSSAEGKITGNSIYVGCIGEGL